MEGRWWPSGQRWTHMTTNTTDDANGRVANDERAARIAELNIGNEEFVIYDRENHQAWLQSSVVVTAADLR